MVNSIVGSLFSNPEDIRAERDKELRAQMLKAQTPLTGSIDSLLGSVVASGAARGNMLGNQVRGMFGVQSPEEQKAAQVQGMVKSVSDFNDPEELKQLAQQLNNAGMTKEAVQVLELYKNAVESQRAKERESRTAEEFNQRTRTVYEIVDVPKRNSAGEVVRIDKERVAITEYYNPETKRFERTNPATKTVEDAPAIKGDLANSVAKKLGLGGADDNAVIEEVSPGYGVNMPPQFGTMTPAETEFQRTTQAPDQSGMIVYGGRKWTPEEFKQRYPIVYEAWVREGKIKPVE